MTWPITREDFAAGVLGAMVALAGIFRGGGVAAIALAACLAGLAFAVGVGIGHVLAVLEVRSGW